MLRDPLCVYINWSAYDELSDAVELTEDVAMRQFDHFLRLRRAGVRLDCYLMDCFWHAPDGGWRGWRRPHWRDDGERWLAACREHGVLPGLWFGCNSLGTAKMRGVPAWADSTGAPGANPCLFAGGYLADFMAALDHWYRRGVRVFKLDFLDQGAHLPAHDLALIRHEIRARGGDAFRTGLTIFRREHPEAVIVGYNGFEDDHLQSGTDFALRRSMDHRWLEALDAFYCGDPRPADVPAASFWRSKDVYSDHMVRAYAAQGFDPARIDNAGFMIGTTGTCYHRGKEGWKGMLLLSLARGGWLNTYYGNLNLLDDADAAWFARAQRLYLPLQRHGACGWFGGLPGEGVPYGWSATGGDGAVFCAVNPGQTVATVVLPAAGGRVLFRDAGFAAAVDGATLILGPEQMAVVGTGAFADAGWDLGVQEDVRIPQAIAPLDLAVRSDGRNAVVATVTAPAEGAVRVVMTQRRRGRAHRSYGGPLDQGRTMDAVLTLAAEQDGRPVAIDSGYGKRIWSGLSWAVGAIPMSRLRAGAPVTLRATSADELTVDLALAAYHVRDAGG